MYCVKCGAQNEDNAKFCRWCGYSFSSVVPQAPVAQPAFEQPMQQPAQQPIQQPQQQPIQQPQQQTYQAQSQNQQTYQQQQQTYQQTPYQQQQQTYQQPVYQQPVAVDNSKLYSILSYIGILWLFGLLMNPEKQNPFVRHHVGQGIILSIFSTGSYIVVSIFSAILHSILAVNSFYYSYATVFSVASVISLLLWLAAVGFQIFCLIYGIVKASSNKMEQLPLIGRFAFIK